MSETKTLDAAVLISRTLITVAREEGWLEKLANLRRKKRHILVLGNSGVGKSQFVESLRAIWPKMINTASRSEFTEEKVLKLHDETFKFVTPPGQELHLPRRQQAMLEAIKVGCEGILNIASYGYHEYDINAKHAVTEEGTVKEEFLEKHRRAECERLNEWTSLLSADVNRRWFITVVTKADLWWDRESQASDHYRVGEYAKALGEAAKLDPVVCKYSSVARRFYGKGSLCGRFDDEDRLRLREHFFRTLFDAVSRSH